MISSSWRIKIHSGHYALCNVSRYFAMGHIATTVALSAVRLFPSRLIEVVYIASRKPAKNQAIYYLILASFEH
jgi:hypothetical protein